MFCRAVRKLEAFDEARGHLKKLKSNDHCVKVTLDSLVFCIECESECEINLVAAALTPFIGKDVSILYLQGSSRPIRVHLIERPESEHDE